MCPGLALNVHTKLVGAVVGLDVVVQQPDAWLEVVPASFVVAVQTGCQCMG